MKKMFFIPLFFFMYTFCYGQHGYDDSVRYYLMINFIIENQSLIQPYMEVIEKEEKTEKYDVTKLYVIPNKMWKIFCTPPDLYDELRGYYKFREYDELYLAIRRDFVKYTFEEKPFDEGIFKKLNNYLDFTLRKGESIDSTQSYWGILFTNSFFDYKSVIIYNHNKLRDINFAMRLEIVFLFDKQNKIKTIKICLLT